MADRSTRNVRKEESSDVSAKGNQRKSTRVTRPKATPMVSAVIAINTVKQKIVIKQEPAPEKLPKAVKREPKTKPAPTTRVRLKDKDVPPPPPPEEPVEHEEESGELFCICRQPYDPRRFMIGCDKCYGWFHARCVNVTATEATRIKCFVCPPCRKKGESEPEDPPSGKKIAPSVKRERPLELEGKPRVFPISKDAAGKVSQGNAHRNKIIAKRQKLAKERAQSGDAPEKDDIIVQANPDETEPEDSGDSSTGLYLSSEDESDGEAVSHVDAFMEGVSEEDRWGENRQAWTSYTKSYVAGPPRALAPVLELDLNDSEGHELRNLVAAEEDGVVNYKLDVDDDFGEWSKFDNLTDATENDNARLAWMEKRREEVELELLVLQKTRFLYDGALAFSIRKTFLRSMDYSVADLIISPLLQGIGTGGVRKGQAQKTKINEQYQTLWRDMLSCRGCLGHIPSFRYAEHVERCSEQPGPRGLWTVKGVQEPIPKLTICGCPLSFKELKGYCSKDSDTCPVHRGWRPKLKQKIERDYFLLNRRLRLIGAEILAVQRRVKERESLLEPPSPEKASARPVSPRPRPRLQQPHSQHHQQQQPQQQQQQQHTHHPQHSPPHHQPHTQHHQHQQHYQPPLHQTAHSQQHHNIHSHYTSHSIQQQQQHQHQSHHHHQQHPELQHNFSSSHSLQQQHQHQQTQHSLMLPQHTNSHLHSHLPSQQHQQQPQASTHHLSHQMQLLPQIEAPHLQKQPMMMMPGLNGMQSMQMMGPGMGQMMMGVQPQMRMDRGSMGMERRYL